MALPWEPVPGWKRKRGDFVCYVQRVTPSISLEIWECWNSEKGVDGWITGIRWRSNLIYNARHFQSQQKAIKFVTSKWSALCRDAAASWKRGLEIPF